MYAINPTKSTNRNAHRSIDEWAKSIDKEIKRLSESKERTYTSAKFSNLRNGASLLGADIAQVYTYAHETLLEEISAYYTSLIADLERQRRLAFQRHENRKGSHAAHNLYAELIAEFKEFKKFMGGTLGDFIISIVPDGVNRYDMCVTDEKLQQHVRHVERHGIGITVVRQSGRMYIHKHI